MKSVAIVGLLLILIGLAALTYQGVTYTTRDTVMKVGPLEATAERQNTILLPPVLGVVAVGAGVVLLTTGLRKRASAQS